MIGVRSREFALVLAIGLFWGLNWPAVKTILGEVPPWTLRAIGLGTGAILLALIARAYGERLSVSPGEVIKLSLAGLFSIFGFNLLAAFGQLHTATSTATIVAFTMPMWAALLSVYFLNDRITAIRLAALALGLAGLAVLLFDDFAGIVARPIGVVYMLGAAVSWALGTVLLKRFAWTIGTLSRATWMVGLSALPMIAGAFLFEDPLALSVPSTLVLWVFAYHIVFPMVICHAAWVSLVGRLPASVAAIGTLLIPVVGVYSSALLLGEPISWLKSSALILVLSSIGLTFLKTPGPRDTA